MCVTREILILKLWIFLKMCHTYCTVLLYDLSAWRARGVWQPLLRWRLYKEEEKISSKIYIRLWFIYYDQSYVQYISRGNKYSGFLSQRISLNILFVFAYEIEIRNPQDCICRQCHKIFKIFKAEIYKFFSELSKTRRVKRSPWMRVQASGMVAVHVANNGVHARGK